MSTLTLTGAREDASKTDVLNAILSFGTPTRIAQSTSSKSTIVVEFSDPNAADTARRRARLDVQPLGAPPHAWPLEENPAALEPPRPLHVLRRRALRDHAEARREAPPSLQLGAASAL